MRNLLFLLSFILVCCSGNSSLKRESSTDLASQSEIKAFLSLYEKISNEKIQFLSFSEDTWHKKPYFRIKSNYEDWGARSLYLLDVDEDKNAEFVYFELDQGSGRYDFVKIFKEVNGQLQEIDYSKSYEDIIKEEMKVRFDTIVQYVPEGYRNTYFSPLTYPVVSIKNGKTRIHWSKLILEYGKNGVTVEK